MKWRSGGLVLLGNLFALAITMALAWSAADVLGDVAGAATGSGNGTFDPNFTAKAAIAGAASGAQIAVLLAFPYWRTLAWGLWLSFFTLIFWSLAEVFLVLSWKSLGVASLDGYLGVIAIIALVYGFLYAIAMQRRKPGLAILKVPLATLLIAVSVVGGRYLQFTILNF